MMVISEQDAVQLMDFSIRYTCVKLRVSEFGIVDHGQLLAMIAIKDAEVHRLLTDFLNSYNAWLDFHKEIDRAGKQGRLDGAETQRLFLLTNAKDTARGRIAERLKAIP